MKKEETQELNELSLKTFGKMYEWKKLTTKGMVVGKDKDNGSWRRIKLTPEQAKQYMLKVLDMRNKVNEELNANSPE